MSSQVRTETLLRWSSDHGSDGVAKPPCSISPMPENDDLDPGAPTQMFQAFVDRQEPETSGRRRLWLALAGAALVVVLVLAWLVLGG
jgi:hypothetical protein